MVFESAQVAGIVYAVISLIVVTTLYRKKKFNRKIAYGFTLACPPKTSPGKMLESGLNGRGFLNGQKNVYA